MIRILMTLALSFLMICNLATPARAAGPEDTASKEDVQKLRDDIRALAKSVKELVDAHNNLVKTSEKRDELVDGDIKRLSDRMNDLDRKTAAAITDLNKKIDD